MREPPRVLIVDDNPANLEILEARLARQGYEIITAADGDAALLAARQNTPDLILLDVMMPGKDGMQVCRELKGDPDLPFMPVILVTAKADPDDIVAGLDAGGDEYITKPVDHAALVARVRSILRIKALHDRVQEQAAQLEDWSRTLERRSASSWPRSSAWTDPDQGDDTRYQMGPSHGGHGFEARGRIGGLTRDRVACSASHQARTRARRYR